MLVVTTGEIHGWDVQRVCGEVYGVVVRGRTVPGQDGERALTDSRTEAISRMLEHARVKGGNLVTGLRFDTADLGDGSSELCAYGTAVVGIPSDDGAKQTATALGYGQPGAAAEPAAAAQQYDPNQQYAQQYGQAQYGQQQGQPQGQAQYGQQQNGQQQNAQQQNGQQYQPPFQGQGYPQQPGYQQYPQQGYPPQ